MHFCAVRRASLASVLMALMGAESNQPMVPSALGAACKVMLARLLGAETARDPHRAAVEALVVGGVPRHCRPVSGPLARPQVLPKNFHRLRRLGG